MSRVSYDGKRLIPAPYVSINKSYIRADDNSKLGTVYNINLIGKTLAHKGSPMSSGWWTVGGFPPDSGVVENDALGTLIKKQEAIRELFSEDYRLLEIQSENASLPPMRCNPQVESLTFSEGPWINYFDYNIALTAPQVYFNGLPASEDGSGLYIDSASETWDIQTDENYETEENRTYRISHSVSVKARPRYDETGALVNEAWKEAREFALPRLGFDTFVLTASGVREIPSYYSPWNFVRGETIDELGGSYSVQESWILASGAAIESFDISVSSNNSNSLTQVSIQGTVQGLELRNASMTLVSGKYDTAEQKYNSITGQILNRAQSYAGITLNIIPISQTVGKNPLAGTINYSYEYDNRPSNLVASARSESITIQDSLPASIIASLPVLGRTRGPVLQDLNMGRESTRTLNVDLVMPTASGLDAFNSNPRTQGLLNDIINAAMPTNTYQIFDVDNQEVWNPRTGQYSYTKVWLYEPN